MGSKKLRDKSRAPKRSFHCNKFVKVIPGKAKSELSPQACSTLLRPRRLTSVEKRKASDDSPTFIKNIRAPGSIDGMLINSETYFFTLMQFSVLKSIIMTLRCPNESCNGRLGLDTDESKRKAFLFI